MKVLSLGWGVQSFTIAAMVAKGELPSVDYAVHADTTFERQGTYAFAREWTPWLQEHGIMVVTVQAQREPNPLEKVNKQSIMIPAFTLSPNGEKGQTRRQCTHDWKIVPMRHFIRSEMAGLGIRPSPAVVEMWLGISYDEWQRARDSGVKYIVNVFPLLDRRITRAACVLWLKENNLPVPPKSSCTFCPYRSIQSWRDLKSAGGSDWDQAVKVDTTIRDKRPPFPLYVHPARKPLSAAVVLPQGKQFELDLETPCDGGVCWT
mgnify:CR=1 FL=1